jgi:hypothetical protein
LHKQGNGGVQLGQSIKDAVTVTIPGLIGVFVSDTIQQVSHPLIFIT